MNRQYRIGGAAMPGEGRHSQKKRSACLAVSAAPQPSQPCAASSMPPPLIQFRTALPSMLPPPPAPPHEAAAL
ncbi:hypothetical protein Nepgr_008319 [Nepenthes gracilis]|uniref:Uncharacterized protein n=1 Tax=Nepenthes gracilis TaxID=150966 RepID=A0AAD3XJ59_NEPGR|nr:hypothetical protein Nepgr_008319 [Nepenthes gracilis]